MSQHDPTRRSLLKAGSGGAIGAALALHFPLHALAAEPQPPTTFDIDTGFAEFMRDIGGTPADAGGRVEFTGSDPLLRSHFRIGACMAIPAMAAGVGAAAIWRIAPVKART